MIIEKNIYEDCDLVLPGALLKMASLNSRVKIIVDEYEIRIRPSEINNNLYLKMVGLGRNVFEDDSVTLQKALRAEWKI